MISIGLHYRGPEIDGSLLDRILSAALRAVAEVCGDFVVPGEPPPDSDLTFEIGSAPAVNVVFYVPGSLGGFDIPKIAASRFSRKQKLLLVDVPVPEEVARAGGSIEFIVDALYQASAIAAEVFARKGTEPFDLAKARACVVRVRHALLARQEHDQGQTPGTFR